MKKLIFGLVVLMAVFIYAGPAFAPPPPPIPEPSTFVLLGLGVVGVVGLAIRNRKK